MPILMSTAVFAAGSWAAFHWCYLPYRCNIFKRAAEASMLSTENLNSPLRRAELARQNLERSQEWIARCPDDLEIYMIAAASLRELGRSEEAVGMYQRAAQLDRRPEIYLNLGQAQAEAGLIGQAIPNLAAAVIFDPSLINEVPATLQQKVQDYVRMRSAAL
jgi:tetratricopeptide (TPR) repeat protein